VNSAPDKINRSVQMFFCIYVLSFIPPRNTHHAIMMYEYGVKTPLVLELFIRLK
jgi:hypothetical protein